MRIARIISSLFLTLAILNCPLVSAQGPSQSAPALDASTGPLAELPEKVHDFGEMSILGLYSYSFVVKNVGTAPLEIKKVIPICGTTVDWFDHTIPPGGEVKIPINLSAGGCGPTGAKKSVLFLTNDMNSYFVLSVMGHSR